MKRALSILLTTAMLLSGIPFSARADEVSEEWSGVVSAQNAEAVSQGESDIIHSVDELATEDKDSEAFLSEEELFQLRMKQVAKDIYTDSGRYELLPTIAPFSLEDSLETTSNGPIIEVYRPQQPWRCRMSEMYGLDMNQVGEQYEEMYSQAVEDSKKINQFIVQFDGAANVSTLETLTNNTTTVVKTFAVGTEEYTVVVLNEKVFPDEYMNSVESAVSFIQPDYELELCTIDTSNQEPSSTEVVSTNQSDNQDIFFASGDVVVALLDTGVDVSHADLVGHLVDGQNFVGEGAVSATGLSFGEAHGTHIAGIIASNAPSVKIMPLQVFEQGKAYTSDVIAAIQYAEEHGAQIVNCSWGLDKYNPVLFTTIQNSDMMFVTAAGNNGADIATSPFYPACFALDNVLSVASVNSDGTVSYFSNYGTSVDYAAPGFDIQSTVPGGGYDKMSGTSISAGVVSAALAMSLSNGEPFSASGSIVSAQGLVNTWGGNSSEFASLNATDIAASASFAMSLKEDGTVWAWGANDYGQCGNDSSNGVPVQIPGLENIKDIAVGWTHGVAVDNDGNLWTWGSNTYGELGDGTTVSRNVPMKLMGVSNVKSVEAAGLDNTSVAVLNDGNVLHWGKAGNIITLSPEELELPFFQHHQPEQGNKIIKAVYAYGGYADAFIALDGNGYIWIWDVSENEIELPRMDHSYSGFSDIAVGLNFVVALMPNGWAYARGQNIFGELGNWSTEPQDQFQLLRESGGSSPAISGVKAIGTSCTNIYLITEDYGYNRVYVSGDTSFEKSGQVYIEHQPIFYQMQSSNSVTSVCGGMGFTIYGTSTAVDSGGGMSSDITNDNTSITYMKEYAMGDNSRGYLGVRREIIEDVSVQVGGNPPLKVIESDVVTVKNIPVFANSDVWKSLEDLVPETITLYLEDGVTTIEREFPFDSSSFDNPDFYGNGYYYYELINGKVYGNLTWLWKDECPNGVSGPYSASMYIEAEPQNVISLPEIEPIVLSDTQAWSVQFPNTIPVVFEESGTSNVPTKWYSSSLSYPLAAGEYTVLGRLDVPTGSLTYSCSSLLTQKIYVGTYSITEVYPPDPIKVEPYIYDYELRELLPKTVTVMLSCGVKKEVPVEWDYWTFASGDIGHVQTITGRLVLGYENGIENPDNLYATLNITARGPVYISSISEINGISVELRAPIEEMDFPHELEVGLTDGTTAVLPVIWIIPSYFPNVVGTHYINGYFVLSDEDDIKDSPSMVPMIEVTVNGESDIIVNIYEPSGVNVEYGTPASDIYLPAEVEVGMSYGGLSTVQVTWNTANFDPYLLGTQTITGSIVPRWDCKNTFGLVPQIEVTVEYPSIYSINEISGVAVEKGTPVNDLALPTEVEVVLSNWGTRMVPVVWNTTDYDPDVVGALVITGTFVLPDDLRNPLELAPQIVVTVQKIYVASIDEISAIEVSKGTPAEELDLPEEVEVDLSDGSRRPVSVSWDTTTYDPDLVGTQTITGTLVLPDDIRNSLELDPQIDVIVEDKEEPIIGIPEVSWEMIQGIWPTQADKEHTLAVRDNEPVHTVAFPEFVTVLLSDDSTVELPVIWKVDSYNPSQTGDQEVKGTVVLPEDGSITNPQNLQPVLNVTVSPREYEVWEAEPLEIEAEVLLGTTIAQLNEQLKAEGKAELDVFAFDLEEDEGRYTFCGINLLEEDNAHYQKDASGQYTLTARMEENFIPYDDDMPGSIYVTVTVLDPSEITEVEPARMDAYQSVDPDDLDGIPTQANVTLENGKTVAVDVEWDWREYRTLKDTAGEHIVLGDFVNLPSSVMQPDGTPFKATMVVNTIEVNYIVTDVLSDNMFEGDAGLTLAELTEMLKPSLTVEITSVTDEIDIVIEYEVAISLEGECDPEYDPECDDLYIIDAVLNLPSNITCPEDSYYNQVFLQINAVDVISVEPLYAIATEGTAFEDIQDLPTQVILTLSSVDLDGNNKTAIATVDWGDGEGYDPFPTQWDEDGTTVMVVTGYLEDYPQYINGAGVPAKLYITVTQSYDLVAITPNRFPASGAMAVNLGSSLQDIYNQLESHSVQITLQSASGVTSIAEVTFLLREEDNPDYDPMHECVGDESITLKAYLPLDSKIKNLEDLGVEIVVALKTYNITNVKPVRIPETGGQLTTGTFFENLGLPEKAPLVRSDGATDSAPVTWDSSKFDPDKIGSQVVNGTFVTPLPVHLKNPNNRQPKAAVTLVNPTAKILSLQQVEKPMMFSLNGEDDSTLPGFEEYCYLAEILYEDGTTSMELISVFVENMQ